MILLQVTADRPSTTGPASPPIPVHTDHGALHLWLSASGPYSDHANRKTEDWSEQWWHI